MTNKTTYDVHPPEPRWTHVALRVNDIDKTIDWYTTSELQENQCHSRVIGAQKLFQISQAYC